MEPFFFWVEDRVRTGDLWNHNPETGFDQAEVERIARLIYLNEYKRRQSAPGVKITQRAYGRDRRYPIVNGF